MPGTKQPGELERAKRRARQVSRNVNNNKSKNYPSIQNRKIASKYLMISHAGGPVQFPIKPNENYIDDLLAAIPEPFFIIDENGYYVQIIGGADRKRYHDAHHLLGKQMHEVMSTELAGQFLAQVKKAIKSEQVLNYAYKLSAKDIKGSGALPGPDGQLWFEAHISPIKKIKGQPRMVAWVAFNITELKKIILEKDSLINQLQGAINEIKTLRGILPICSFCKKIRDDKGYWNELEAYIDENSDADLSHSVCPDCAKKQYPDYFETED